MVCPLPCANTRVWCTTYHVQALSYGVSPTVLKHWAMPVCPLPCSNTGLRCVPYHVPALGYGVSPTVFQHRDMVCHLPCSSTEIWCHLQALPCASTGIWCPHVPHHVPAQEYSVSPTMFKHWAMVCPPLCVIMGVWCVPY